MPKAKKLTEQAVRDWFGGLERLPGRLDADAVGRLIREGETIEANVRGSRKKSYQAQARVRNGVVTAANCSCPGGDTGRCPHVAALLLAFVEYPDQFVSLDDLDADLNARDKAELVALIKQLVRRVPKLKKHVTAPTARGGKSASTNPDTFRRQAVEVIRESDPEDDMAADQIASGLRPLLDSAREFERKNDFEAAAAVYQGVTAAVIEEDFDYLGDYGEDSDVSGDLTDGMLRALTHLSPGAPRRESLLRSLHDLLKLGGDLGENRSGDRFDILLKTVAPEERRTLAGWLRHAGGSRKGRPDPADYQSKQTGRLLLRVDADVLDDDAYLAHCRRYGLREELIERLIARKRVPEAIQEVDHAAKSFHDLLPLCRLLVRHKLGSEAEQLVRDRAGWDGHDDTVRWLRDRAAERKDFATAIELTERLLDRYPSLELYNDLKKWTPAAAWPAKQKTLFARLEEREWYPILAAIYQKEGNPDEALRVARLSGHLYLMLEVARAAEKSHPEETIPIYQQAAEQSIERRSRQSYQEACRHLKTVATLMTRTGQTAELQRYITGLAGKYQMLPAFQEELRAAKLITGAVLPTTGPRTKKRR